MYVEFRLLRPRSVVKVIQSQSVAYVLNAVRYGSPKPGVHAGLWDPIVSAPHPIGESRQGVRTQFVGSGIF
jgi:hypothetical protein